MYSHIPHFFFDNSPRFQMIELAEATSTNTFLAHFVPQRETRLTLVTAEHQTAGRGQRGNTWESTDGQNLLFSIMVRPQSLAATQSFVLSEAMALAIYWAVATVLDDDAEVSVKWPNDIYVGKRKIAGILIENDLAGRNISRSILGCGINVNQQRFEFDYVAQDVAEPTSLQLLTHTLHERRDVLAAVMSEFDTLYAAIERGRYGAIHDAYMDVLYRREGYHVYRDEAGVFKARVDSIEPTGHLHLVDEDGRDRRYAFKEVAFC